MFFYFNTPTRVPSTPSGTAKPMAQNHLHSVRTGAQRRSASVPVKRPFAGRYNCRRARAPRRTNPWACERISNEHATKPETESARRTWPDCMRLPFRAAAIRCLCCRRSGKARRQRERPLDYRRCFGNVAAVLMRLCSSDNIVRPGRRCQPWQPFACNGGGGGWWVGVSLCTLHRPPLG